MIPQDFVTEWSNQMPWKTNEQVEQDLVISRSIVELFSDNFLASNLAFRGGTALHKLYLNPPLRYSEDIDLVQISAKPFGPVIDRIRERLAFLGEPHRKQKANNNTLYYRFESEFPPVQRLRLKVETNCREHFSVLGLQKIPFQVQSSYFEGKCDLTTYRLEELLGTKLRALYQRRKGRDLYDLSKTLIKTPELITEDIIICYHEYMKHAEGQPPGRKQFLQNIENKMLDPEFLGDTNALLRPGENYIPQEAFELVKSKLILKI